MQVRRNLELQTPAAAEEVHHMDVTEVRELVEAEL